MNTLKPSLYTWQGTSSRGESLSGDILAFSLNLAKINLAKKGFTISVIKKKSPANFKQSNTISRWDVALFFRQLATLIMAGIPISDALQVLNQNSVSLKIFLLLAALKDDIAAGNSLALSVQKFPRFFDMMTCSLISAGEKSGTLDIMLERIASHKEKLTLLKNKIKQALFYPLMIVTAAIIVTVIMLMFVIPRFAELFTSMHSTLPLFTLMVINLANFIHHWIGMISFILMLLGGGLYTAKNTVRTRWLIDQSLLTIPFLGGALKKYILAGFARSLATVFAAGVPITEALNILINSTGNSVYTKAIQKLYLDISAGKQLHVAIHPGKLFPPMMIQMIQIGEESGTLEKMLIKVAEFYESDLDHLINNLSRLLEPLIMMILGVVIGGLVIAMYLPIFRLGAVI